MLLFSTHNHIAHLFSNPERERRLVCFSNGGGERENSNEEEQQNAENPSSENAENTNTNNETTETDDSAEKSPETPTGGGESNPENPVDAERGKTQDELKEAMNEMKGGGSTETTLSEKIADLEPKAQKTHEELQYLKQLAAKHASSDKERKEIMETIVAYEKNVGQVLSQAGVLYDIAHTQEKWENKDYSPQEYAESINAISSRINRIERNANMPTITLPNHLRFSRSEWDDLDLATQNKYIEETDEFILIQQQIDTASLLNTAKERYEFMDNWYKEMLQLSDALKGLEVLEGKETTIRAQLAQAANSMPVQFLTLRQLGMGIKNYWDAFNKAKEQWDQQRASGVAKNIGNAMAWMPYNEQINAVLDAEVENKHTEEKDEYKKLLESQNKQFHAALADLVAQQGQPNKMRAVAEYMADNGWLYDFDRQNGTVFGMQLAMPDSWNEPTRQSYLIQLNLMYSSGEEKMKKRGKDLVDTVESIPPIIEELENELELQNYWSAYGILEVAYAKGKKGEVGTWVAATIMRFLRNNEDARRYFPKDLLDQLGNLGIVHPAWTNTLFKVNRDAIGNWQKTNNPERFDEAGDLGKAITMLEEEVDTNLGPRYFSSQTEKTRFIAKIMAAQVLTENGHTFSIFKKDYTFYRQAFLDNRSSTKPGEADDDFFGNISDALLISQDGFNEILVTTSQGPFTHKTKALSYLMQVLELNDQLKDADKGAYKNFQEELRTKFESYMQTVIKPQPNGISSWKYLTAFRDEKLKLTGKERIIDELNKRGLLTDETKKFIDERGK